MAEEDSAAWETVPVKPKREVSQEVSTATSDVLQPQAGGWDEPTQASDEADGGWEVPNKQTKMEHQPDSSTEGAVAIKAMHPRNRRSRNGHPNSTNPDGYFNGRQAINADMASSSNVAGFANGRQRGARGRSSRGRGRGRGRYSNSSTYDRQQSSQLDQQDSSSWNGAPAATTAASDMEGNLPSSWGAETVFPLHPSPIEPSQLEQAAVPRVLTVRRQQPPRQSSQANTSNSTVQQQQPRRGDRRHRGRGRIDPGNGSQSGPYSGSEAFVSNGHPAVQQGFNFGNFEPGDFDNSEVNLGKDGVTAESGTSGQEGERNLQGLAQKRRGRGRGRSGRGGRTGPRQDATA